MRFSKWLALFAAFFFSSSTLFAADDRMALRFHEGQTIRYQYQEVMNYTPPAKFAGSAEGATLAVKVDYTWKVTRVNPDNSAIVKLRFDRVVVEKDGIQIADIADHQIPKQGQNITAILKVNGEVDFYKYVYLTLNPANVLEYRIVNGGNAMATKSYSNEGEKEVFASDLDITSGMIRIGVPPTRMVSDPEFSKLAEVKLDLTPRKLYELLLLPTAPMGMGQRFVVPNPYLASEVITYEGLTDVQGKRCDQIRAKIAPWEGVNSANAEALYEPQLSGMVDYFIDSELGRLVTARGTVTTSIHLDGIGEQSAEIRMNLQPRR